VKPVSLILERFRRGAGVPVTAVADVAAELAPVFAALDEIEAEAERRREAARRRAQARIRTASDEAEQLSAFYRERAEAAYATAVERSRRAAEEQTQALLAEAEDEARRIHLDGEARLPGLVAAVLSKLRGRPA
jgi:vacuolar-type H+-ATPase subunit H